MILLGSRIKQLRQKEKYTQAELAIKVGVTKSTIAAYENDTRTPSYEVLIKLAESFKVSLDYLVLNREDNQAISVSELSPSQINAVKHIVSCFEANNHQLKHLGITLDDKP